MIALKDAQPAHAAMAAPVAWASRPTQTILEVLATAVAEHGQDVFLDFQGKLVTYAAFDDLTNRLAQTLRDRGLGSGQTIASMLDNNLEAIVAWFAANKLGAIYVPINTAYKGDFLLHLLSDCEARIVLAEEDYAQRILSLGAQLGDLELLYVRGAAPAADVAYEIRPLAEALAGPPLPEAAAVRPMDVSALIYTAGTTGPSKGCMIVHNQMCEIARLVLAHSGRTRDEIAWTCLPLFHLNALCSTLLQTVMIGGRAAIFPRFSVSRFWDDIERSGARIVNALGTMIPLLAAAPESPAMLRCKGQIRVARGAPFTPENQRIWRERFGIEIVGADTYGITEANPITSATFGDHGPPGSSGKASPLFEVVIVDDEDRPAPIGTAGEVIIRPKAPHVMFAGYWKRPADTVKLMGNLWFHTGDIGKFDADGWFYFVDRKKDYLRRGGENISSFEMERSFMRHPDIAEVAVHAVLSELSEDEVKVTAVLHEGSGLTERALAEWSIDNFPYFAVPRYVEFRAALPKNEVGRVLKYQLRDEGCTTATWDSRANGLEYTKR